ncbi:MAG: rRNA 5-hydroxycytidine synthase [Pseudomonadota bacterium]|nr:rRNA 5-hydroxycytidine synthase [Pseudomonadota bacterium]
MFCHPPMPESTIEHPERLELLAPAKTGEFGIEAINHGADAVYIGGPAFGARANAGNDIGEIARLAEHAHRYNARVLVALNTILHDSELEEARKVAWQVFEAGADALIVQDMGLLEVDLPPIELHASTQCDIRTVEKAKFLGEVGFSQMVLARELSLAQIREIHAATDATLEFFIHGALCVAFSGQCYISHAHTDRSANRGDCSQDCRLPYTLSDDQGRVVAFEKHLLSMKDNNQTSNLEALIAAGIRSFKIEGRYKDLGYVKNITGHYRRELDHFLEGHPQFRAAASGKTTLFFTPNPDKTFHRGTTDYFVNDRKTDIGAFDSPKFVGLPIGTVTRLGSGWFEMEANEPLTNGDGLNYMHKREVIGLPINVAEKRGEVWRCTPNVPLAELPGLQPGTAINRNGDHAWELALTKKSAERRVAVDLDLAETDDGFTLRLVDEEGISATAALKAEKSPATQPDKVDASLRENLGKLGTTIFAARNITLALSQPWFLPASSVNALRREAVAALEAARSAAYQRPARKPAVEPPAPYPEESLSYLANIYNDAARQFYAKHGVKLMDAAFEAHEESGEVSLMVTKHCLRFSFNLCPKQAKGVTGVQGQIRAEPMTLVSGGEKYTLRFDCRPCEMHVVGKMKKHILQSPPPTTVAAPLVFHRQRPGADS